ncbi:MAG TPA: KH domain-containing protein, partial [Desulfobacterales bacterium]|nr:KH domain-containing protein [Desulfobacterales bacterium]
YNHSAVESEVSTPSSIVQEVFDAPEIDALSESPSELGREALQRIVDFITTDAEISVRETPERIFFNVEGGNTAVLIGKRGQTLEAIQYLVEKIINKRSTKRIRIQVDVEGYLDGRKAKLEGLAARLSEKAKRIGKPVTIGQLNAHDRRIVHIALKDDSNVRTQSMGDGFYRKLVIFPQRKFPRKKEIS